MAKGYLALLLHCHLPYVRHPEHEDFLEEDWFYEAVAETYVPLFQMLERLEGDGVRFGLTISVSPTLCEMLSGELLRSRCTRYLDRHVALGQAEVRRCAGTPFEDVARMYRDRYRHVRHTYVERLEGGLLSALASFRRTGRVELLASCATHGLLPLLATAEGRRAQVAAGVRNFEKHFGRRPAGFWLPECAYAAGTEDLLAEFGFRYFFVDTHGILLARPRPPLGVFAPLTTPAGVLAFGRDVESSRQVWSADEGYPGGHDYREFYRDLGYDAELDYLRPYLPAGGERRQLGFKYHRITGRVPLEAKEPYRPRPAAKLALEHARHFIGERLDQTQRVWDATGVAPVLLCPYDAELFGHWWFEGLQFLEAVIRLADREDAIECVTIGQYLERRGDDSPGQEGRPAESTWGDRGYYETWVNGSNDWLYPRLREAESRMVGAAARFRSPDAVVRRALNQCARHLLLAQSSDWPFLISTATAAHYAAKRFQDEMHRFDMLVGQLSRGVVDVGDLERCEWLDDPFAELDYRLFTPRSDLRGMQPSML